jgi:hypothetical protein
VFSWAADCRASGVVSGARPRFCMTEADMRGDGDDIELTVMPAMYCLPDPKETARPAPAAWAIR